MRMVRLYYFKGKMEDGPLGKVRMLGGNTSWSLIDIDSHEFAVKVRNLTNSGHTLFTSPPLGSISTFNIDEVIRHHAGSNWGPGLIEGLYDG